MKKHIIHALLLSSPIIVVIIPTLVLTIISFIFSLVSNTRFERSLITTFFEIDLPAIILFTISSLTLISVYYLAFQKKKIALQLSYIFTVPLIYVIYSIITQLILPIFVDNILSQSGAGLAFLFIVPILGVMLIVSILYLYFARKKITEIYNS